MSRLVIDPMTRIEGHLRIEVEIEGGRVKDAWSSGTLFRGFEVILRNRDPRDAWLITQRICGVCPISHGLTSVFALEDAFGVEPPDVARIVRNLIEGTQILHSHILWFYHLNGLDYVDVVSALKATPKEKSLKDLKEKLVKFVNSGQLGPFANGYWGHPEYKLPPDLNLLVVSHYLQALEMQAKASKLTAIFGGKMPMHMNTPPGGLVKTPTVQEIKTFLYGVKEIKDFVNNVMYTDLLALAPYYLDWAKIGKGVENYLAWGVFEDESKDPVKRFLPRGVVYKEKLEVMDATSEEVTEHVRHSFYEYNPPLNPKEGKTEPRFIEHNTEGTYSWLKAPRYGDRPMEVGALSRILIAYLRGREPVKKEVDTLLAKIGEKGNINVLKSVVGRIAARVIESKVVAQKMEEWTTELLDKIKNRVEVFRNYEIPKEGEGVGLWEAPRGALGHWVVVKDHKIANYQCVVPTTWNASPRDDSHKRGPIEEALIGTPVLDPQKPLEILRVVHSFDPCIACAVHVIDPRTNEIYEIKVV
jgi:[NiFe] hydrogenase large subunit